MKGVSTGDITKKIAELNDRLNDISRSLNNECDPSLAAKLEEDKVSIKQEIEELKQKRRNMRFRALSKSNEHSRSR